MYSEHVQTVRHTVHHVVLVVLIAYKMLQLIDLLFMTIQIDCTATELQIDPVIVVIENDLGLFEPAFEFLHKNL